MRQYDFRVVNVFAETPLAGNPLCVFEDARDLDAVTMQALALQFNLSETTFILPSANAATRVRIFTPTFEMPFAGHPTLGTAHVVRDLLSTGDALTLEMEAGVVPVTASGDVWTLQANAPAHRAPAASRAELASMLGLDVADLSAAPALWVNTGSDQLLVPLASFAAVRRAAPRAEAMLAHGSNGQRAMAYLFAREGGRVLSRFFFPQQDRRLQQTSGEPIDCIN
jgi:trans-2,3-dihydro-3-hydroxyanthranilate isomerase